MRTAKRHHRNARQSDDGVTLVEVLVVLVLIGVMASAIGLSVGASGRSDALNNQAVLLVARLDRAADDALLTGRSVRFQWDEDGYRFQQLVNGDWQAHPLPVLGDDHKMGTSVRLAAASGASGAWTIRPDLLPASDSGPLVIRMTERSAERTVLFDGLRGRIAGGPPS